jgi:hypothetical protein
MQALDLTPKNPVAHKPPKAQRCRHSNTASNKRLQQQWAHPQPPNFRLLLQLALLDKGEGGARTALHAAKRSVAQPRVKEPA